MSEFPPEGGVDGFYESIRRWDEILRRKDSEYWFQLVPGRALSTPSHLLLRLTALVFDNWRVLHGRSAFVGERRMCGAYVSRDAFVSRYLTTNVEREKLLLEI
jgi:trimethyllysine dioxygenase